MPGTKTGSRPLRFLIFIGLGFTAASVLLVRLFREPIPYGFGLVDVMTGVFGGLSLVLVNFPIYFLGRRFGWAAPVYRLLDEEIHPLIRQGSIGDLVTIAAIAGFSEELLFRGLFQPHIGLAAASALFGFLHAPVRILWPLALWAGGNGLLLGITYQLTGNLFVPMLMHALYDLVALVYWHRKPAVGEDGGLRRHVALVPFVKADAHGNDFIIVAGERLDEARNLPLLARQICNRASGPGADGLILYRSAGDGRSRVVMELWNSDGSRAEISGNGLRCLAAVLAREARAGMSNAPPEAGGFDVEIDTDAGRKQLTLTERDGERFRFRANMGPPRLGSLDLPFELDGDLSPVIGVPLVVDGETLAVTVLSMGNPHCVAFVSEMSREELRRLGPAVERHPRFPEGTNFELVRIAGEAEIQMMIWERGAGETKSSGTGSAAAAVAAMLNDPELPRRLLVDCPGGRLEVEWEEGMDGDVFVTGEAALVEEGVYSG